MTQALTKAWDTYLISEKTTPSECTYCFFFTTFFLILFLPDVESISRASRGSEKRGLLRSSVNKKKEMDILRHTPVEEIVRVSPHIPFFNIILYICFSYSKEYVDVMGPLLVLAAVKHEDLITLKHQRVSDCFSLDSVCSLSHFQNLDYRLRFTVLEWSRIEWELTRESGLWGPDHPSPLDKWMLDTVEGPYRMRKRMCRNHLFYHEYPYNPSATLNLKVCICFEIYEAV